MPTFPYVPFTYVGSANEVTTTRLNASELGIRDAHFQPCVRVFHNANQSIATATDTALAFNSERFDQAGNAADTMHDNVTNNSRLTCRYAGVYQVTGMAGWAANATGIRQLSIRHSVGPTKYSLVEDIPSASSGTYRVVTALIALAVNEYVELVAFQSSGAGLNILASGNFSPEFMMVRVG
jgi:hypothetical protein